MAHGSPAKTLRSSKRKRTQNPRYVDDISDVDMTDSDKSELGESPETRSRGRRSKVVEQTSPTDTRHSKPRSSQQRSLSSETNDISFFRREWNKAKEMNTTTLAEGSSAHQTPPSDTDILSRVAPTAVMISPPSDTSGLQTIIPVPNDAPKLPSIEEESRQAASPLPEVQRKVPPAEMGGQEKAQPVPHDQSKPRKPRPEFKIAYTIVKTRTPRLHLSVWEDGTFAGRSLQSVVESISRIVGRGQIETLTCTLYTPEMNKDFTIKKDAESTFESMKHEYGKMMLSSYRRLGQKKPFEIQIEPAYSDERRDESYSDSEASGLDGW
ncbi:hypothetical protein MMC15_006248 [Xylographa vitiligo]|nr:hypothetical protein [Xylographa vitiligo]